MSGTCGEVEHTNHNEQCAGKGQPSGGRKHAAQARSKMKKKKKKKKKKKEKKKRKSRKEGMGFKIAINYTKWGVDVVQSVRTCTTGRMLSGFARFYSYCSAMSRSL